jgi:hypothetical protein
MTKLDSFLHRLADAPFVTLIGLLLLVLTVAGLFGARRLVRTMHRTVTYDVALLGATLLWWLTNHRLEGRVLFTVSQTHGLTLGDMLGLPALIVAAGLFIVAKGRGHLPMPGWAARMGEAPRE